MTFRYYLNIGTSLGDRERNLESAIKALSDGAEHVKESEVVKSKPWGFESPNEFLNVGVALDSSIEPLDMLDHIHDLEHSLGSDSHRDERGNYIDRLVDIDIMAIEQTDGTPVSINTPTLTVPHPHLADRQFFLTPYRQLKSK